MAKKRRLSYEATAGLAIAGGAIALAAVIAVPLLPSDAESSAVLTQVIATIGVAAWFFGAAAGVLALSTPFSRRATVGLALCGVTAAIVLVSVMTGCAGTGETEAERTDPAEPATSANGDTPAESATDPYYDNFEAYLLDGYPEDAVPLYESLAVDTSHYSVRNDPQWVVMEGGLRNYYHVVYYSSASPEEIYAYYRGLMSEVDEVMSVEDILVGTIREYDIWLNTSPGALDDTTVYLTVDLPRSGVTETNPFFADYPEGLVEVEPVFTRFEHKFEVNSTDDGRIVYLEYFEMPIEEDEYFAFYRERYGDREGFTAGGDGLISWEDEGYSITLSRPVDHQRLYMAISQGM